MSAKIICFAGSARKDSLNKKLAKAMAKLIENEAAEATFVDLNDYPMPLYHGDLEEADGLPESAAKLKQLFSEHDGFLIASPEYNGLFSPLLKNTVDWISRKGGSAEAFHGKVAGIVSTSPGALGGLRGLIYVRAMLAGLGIHVIPQQVALPKGAEAIDDDFNVIAEPYNERLAGMAKALVETTTKLCE